MIRGLSVEPRVLGLEVALLETTSWYARSSVWSIFSFGHYMEVLEM